MSGSSLNAARRAAELVRSAEETVDVLVVGLGATGAGAALDAASRGLSVAAIDACDLAFGTSRWSSKMIHGGLRYLAKGQLGVARESAVERGILLTRTAPHLVRAHPYLLPLTPAVSRRQAALVMTGYRLGDGLRAAARTPRRLLPGPSRLTAARALAAAPVLRGDGLRGALLSWDGRLEDDARLVVAVARTAAAHGARILTRCRALELSATGARVRDELSGREFSIRARAVVNAAGVWAGRLNPEVTLRPSRGTHLVFRAEELPGLRAGLHVPIPGEGNRFALVLPQHDGRVYVGLTDEPVDGPIPDVPEAPEEDIRALLAVLNSVLEVPVPRAAVAGAYAGLRPLLAAEGRTADLSRRHAVLDSGGFVTVVGGKLTTYRRMAQDAVDHAVRLAGLAAGPCLTAHLPLVGRAVHAYAEAEPEPAGPGVTKGELRFAVEHEGALDESDLLDRRTRIGLVAADREAALPIARDVLKG
ncbi:glycerol-3-phosphate dehydrogenase/oxidase [Nonomuraea typhae]|uniref:Glycerol-3-phosphate dehydrogenase/oxidase n=1 Tax=Nonomuraea typhae TaxID=2603600 RepID=A0ABW7YKJ1_9ACTN